MLGAGGPLGHAYHAGVLAALHHCLGWDARDAELVLGTSAGAQVAALLRAGMSGDDLKRRAAGQALRPKAAQIARHFIRPDYDLERRRARRRFTFLPAAPSYLSTVLRAPRRLHLGKLLSALLPEGVVRLDEQAHGLRRLFGTRWPERRLWITAVHLDSGDRVAFGAAGAPRIDVGTAVACSGAVPGVCAPIAFQGRRYIDGGIASATHLDLLDPHEFDLALVSSPLSMFRFMRGLLSREVQRLARRVPVVCFEPKGQALKAMGNNPLIVQRAPAVAKAAFETTLAELDLPQSRALREHF